MQRIAEKQHNMMHRPLGKQKLVVNLQLSKADSMFWNTELKSFLIVRISYTVPIESSIFAVVEGCVEGKLLRVWPFWIEVYAKQQ